MKITTSIAAFLTGVTAVCAAGMLTLGNEGAAAAIAKDGSRWTDAFGTASTVTPTPTAAGKTDRLPMPAAANACEAQPWPYVAPDCLIHAEGMETVAARTITIEHRTAEANTTVLVRVPVMQLAAR